MGFRLETASGRSLAVKAAKKHGAPATVNLDALLEQAPASRAKWVQDRTDRRLTDNVKRAVQAAGTLEALHAALDPVVDRRATPDLVPAGALVLQPSPERRRSGSHYTPRALTEPIVCEALTPVLDRLRAERDRAPGGVSVGGGSPGHRAAGHGVTGDGAPGGVALGSGDVGNAAPHPGTPLLPSQILDLKICDPAMGSGAFLVEAGRQLGDQLVEAWRVHGGRPEDTTGEDDVTAARRLVAQRCLYGVDRNPVAVDLANCRCGWPRSPATSRSPSSTTPCARATPSSASRADRSQRSTGRPTRPSSSPGSRRCRGPSTSPERAPCAGVSAKPAAPSPTGSSATCGTSRGSRPTTSVCSAI